jgi:SAM-dependent methyltransferase
MEIGTTGRYVGRLQSSITFAGDIVLLNAVEPTYSPVDIVERGQLSKIGRYVPLKDYLPITRAEVGDSTLDVVANFIGFHHSPPDRRDGFVDSVRRVLRPGGRLILRDHDVNSVEMNHMVALAHDVFNMGLGAPWDVNQREIRNFTSVNEISRYLESRGFRMLNLQRPLLQPGDPTHNALMDFVKV